MSGIHALPRAGDDGLIGSRCPACGQVTWPPRLMHCARDSEELVLDGAGAIESWTTIRVAPERFHPPYHLAYVRLQAGPRVLVRMDGEAEPEAGRAVRVYAADQTHAGAPLLAVLAD